MCSLISPSVVCFGIIIIFLSIYIYLFNTFYFMLSGQRNEDESISKSIPTKSLCDRPFVQIGKNCYFFLAMNTPKEYYKIKYKNHSYSVPTKLDWMHTSLSCQSLDPKAHPISIENAKEMKDIAFFMVTQNYPLIYKFWTSGHRSMLDDEDSLVDTFFWFHSEKPMNFTNWLIGQPKPIQFPEGFCINLQLTFGDLLMATTNCLDELPFACELDN